jgi:hypothetical protein
LPTAVLLLLLALFLWQCGGNEKLAGPQSSHAPATDNNPPSGNGNANDHPAQNNNAVEGSINAVSAAAGQDLPTGIPRPSFGYDLDTSRDGTIFVDNTHPDCNNAVGTAATPLCDLFRGGRSVTYNAGDVVLVRGGPCRISGNLEVRMTGEARLPVIIRGVGARRILFDGEGSRVDFTWDDAFGVIENIDFYHKTRHAVAGHHMVWRNIGVRNPIDAFINFNPVVNVRGHDVLIHQSEIGNNRRESDKDSHGIQAGAGSYNVWILDNEIYNNNGDAFQGCHECFDAPPHHIYLSRNTIHDDRENAVDLKTIHDVIVSENVMYGYGSSTTSSGDAMVVGSTGFDAATNMGPRRIWMLNNEFRQSTRALRIEGSEDVWVPGNIMTDVGQGVQIDNKPHRRIVVAANTIVGAGSGITGWGCQPSALWIVNNIIDVIDGRHVGLADCGSEVVQLENNLFRHIAGRFEIRVDGTNYRDLQDLETAGFGRDNLLGVDNSRGVDAGASLEVVFERFRAAYGMSIAFDRAGASRPAGGGQDIGAFER